MGLISLRIIPDRSIESAMTQVGLNNFKKLRYCSKIFLSGDGARLITFLISTSPLDLPKLRLMAKARRVQPPQKLLGDLRSIVQYPIILLLSRENRSNEGLRYFLTGAKILDNQIV
jgi:hypothetical protein